MRCTALLSIVLAAVPCTAISQQSVHRCIGEHGEISFSGTPCAGANVPAGATSVPTPIDSKGAAATDTCPATTEALRAVVVEAFARRDANTLAGVMRWDGVGSGAARERMRELADLTGRPLLGIDMDGGDVDAPPSADDAQPGRPPRDDAARMVLHTGSLDGGASEHEFRLTPAGGCYWLDW